MKRSLIIAFIFALGLLATFSSVARAHERRVVGKYEFVVGFLTEPAYVNQPNSIDLRITNTETKNPVEGLEKTLQVEVIFGARSMPLALAARFGQPGAYNGYLIPTKTGTYIFHITGNIEGTKIDENFESGPGRFNDLQDTTALQFPDKLAAPQEMVAQLQAARDAAANAQTFAYIGIGVGVIGILVGAYGLMRRK